VDDDEPPSVAEAVISSPVELLPSLSPTLPAEVVEPIPSVIDPALGSVELLVPLEEALSLPESLALDTVSSPQAPRARRESAAGRMIRGRIRAKLDARDVARQWTSCPRRGATGE